MRLSPPGPTSYLGWAARISSVFSLALLSLFFFGKPDDGAPVPALGWDEWLLFLFFPIGLAVGMILGWWHCQLGGIVAVASLAAFYVVEFLLSGSFPSGIYFALIALPGLLFLVAAFGSDRGRPA